MELILILVIGVVGFRVWRARQPAFSRTPGDLVGPVGWTADMRWTTVAPLLRADLRRVLLHPAFLFGVAITWGMVALALSEEDEWLGASAGVALGLVPLGWMTIIATNLTALRPRRRGTEELFASLPAPQPVRTSALLATAIGPGLVATLHALGAVVWLMNRDRPLPGSPLWQEIAVGVVIVIGAVAVGVAVARWLPNGFFGVLAVVVVTLIQARVFELTAWPWHTSDAHPARFLAFLAEPSSVADRSLELRPSGWHLVYLLGWTATVALVGILRDHRGARPAMAVFALSLLTVGVTGWIQTRPLSDASRDQMVSYLLEPELHQLCRTVDDIRYCAYPGHSGELDDWQATTAAVLAQLPPAASARAADLDLVQRPATIIGNSDCGPSRFRDSLHPTVAARVEPARLWVADGDVHPSFGGEAFPCSNRDDHGFFLAVQVAAWAAGLPPAPHHDDQRCLATGQARSAIALWAAATAAPDGARTMNDVVRDGRDRTHLRFDGWDSPPMWGVTFAAADAEVAKAMLALPDERIRSALSLHWDLLMDRTTATAVLAEVLGTELAGATPAVDVSSPAACR